MGSSSVESRAGRASRAETLKDKWLMNNFSKQTEVKFSEIRFFLELSGT